MNTRATHEVLVALAFFAVGAACSGGGGDDDGDGEDSVTTFSEVTDIVPSDSVAMSQVSAGATLVDYDNDGDIDIITEGGITAVGTIKTGVALLQNDGAGNFTDVSDTSGLSGVGTFSSVIAFDYDNDGDQDLIVSSMESAFDGSATHDATTLLYRNEGDGTFTDVTEEAGISVGGSGVAGPAVADIDNDGYLDLYVPQNIDMDNFFAILFMPSSTEPATLGYPDLLFHNNGDGTFTEESAARGVGIGNDTTAPSGRPIDDITLDALFFDYDNDGDVDLFATNDFAFPYVYRNDGTGHFEDVSYDVGLTDLGWGGWMGIQPVDLDGDGSLELVFGNLGSSWLSQDPPLAADTALADFSPYHAIVKIDGDGSMRNIAADVLVTGALELPNRRPDVAEPVGFQTLGCTWGAPTPLDYDNDGLIDFYNTGSLTNGPEDGILYYQDAGAHPGQLLRGQPDGSFVDVTRDAGVELDDGTRFDPQWSNSAADLDRDGFDDLVATIWTLVPDAKKGRLRLFMNDGNQNHWLAVKLQGTTSNRDAAGAIVRVYVTADASPQVRGVFIHGWGGSRDALHFGLGSATSAARVEIDWPAGGSQVLMDVAADEVLMVTEP